MITMTVDPAVGSLLPGGTAALVITIDIPSGASYGDMDVATIMLTSQGDPVETAEAMLMSEVAHMIFLPLIVR